MLLETLRDFEWYNEAEEVTFSDRGVKITAAPGTDFWQDVLRGHHKDNGHFFFAPRSGAFTLTVCWQPGIPLDFAQCGLMGRADENHWFKISLMSKNGGMVNVCSVVTNSGNSDMSLTPCAAGTAEIWFRLKKGEDGVCELSYSTNGIAYIPLRRFRLLAEKNTLAAGVFISSPSDKPYTALLKSIDFS